VQKPNMIPLFAVLTLALTLVLTLGLTFGDFDQASACNGI